ncbi:MAG: tetratricopeptide repeat protein [Limisphaerales bacterium]
MSRILEITVNVFLLLVITGVLGWIFLRSLKRSYDPGKLIFKWALTTVVLCLEFTVARPAFVKGGGDAMFGLGLTLVFGLIMAITWRHAIIDLIANPIGSLYDGGREEIEPKPYYSIALAKRKRSKPLEAIVEIRRQLAKFPNDFEGVSLLASVQAEDMKDLPGAEMTFNYFCDWSEAPPRQVAAALTQLADWHLKIANDVDSAREVLERIIARLPGTAQAAQAAQRIAHLGGTEKILLAAQDRQAVFVPEGVNNIGLLDSTEFLRPVEMDPKQQASEYVKHLEQYPLDTEVREKLAIIYARDYQRIDLASLELMQLINEPKQTAKQVARWLNLLADLQIQGGADYEAVRETLEKIVQRFPDLPVAERAQARLSLLKLEFKGQEKETPGKKLGVYEQNIGLKYGSPRKL